MSDIGRRIGVLIIEDDLRSIETLSNRYLDLVICGGIADTNNTGECRSLSQAMAYVEDRQITIDAIIFDINMYQDFDRLGRQENVPHKDRYKYFAQIQDFQPGQDMVCPYGPVLTLPFLAYTSPFLHLQPISAFWTQPGVLQNDLFLLSLSMLMSRVEEGANQVRTPFEIRQLVEEDEDRGLKALGLGARGVVDDREFLDATFTAVQEVRAKLLNGDVFVTNMTEVLRGLSECIKINEQDGDLDDLKARLRMISLNFETGAKEDVDCIRLSSLYADVFSTEGIRDGLYNVLGAISEYERNGDLLNYYEYAEQAKKLIAGLPDEEDYPSDTILSRLGHIKKMTSDMSLCAITSIY